jgi:BirA family biotin operon repressor/biotin-[acetyl-CoA-carboxylase] ligase
MPAEIRDSATSLAELGSVPVDRVALLSRLLDGLSTEVAGIEDGRSPLARYRERCRTLGTTVSVATGDRTIQGLAVGLDEEGALLLDTSDGRRRVESGEVLAVRSDHR